MKILMDSDALFALYVVTDQHHQQAKQIFQKLLKQKAELITTNLVLQEAATVLSYKAGQRQACDFLQRFAKINIRPIFIREKLTAQAWKLFKKQKKKGTSFIDCANIVLCQEMKIPAIFSFDKFYFKIGSLKICFPE